ncbi:hypothetical protein LCGC14_1660710 [marine sediment metagenome]|uniref:C-type cytochrome biogenesis protein CcmI n=1 Tax=marine sediment metagenome TaxID=412755 RepID=A0A0F9HUU6_9ZZZZ
MIWMTMALISLAAVAFIVYPLLKGENSIVQEKRADDGLGDIALRKESVYASLKEVEFDYQTGKLSREDYEGLRSDLESMALSLLKEADRPKEEKDRHKTIDEEIELEVLKARKKKALSSHKERGEGKRDIKEETEGGLNNDQKE